MYESEDKWESFAASSAEGEDLGESGEGSGMLGIDFECFAARFFCGGQESEAIMQNFSSFECSGESVAGVWGDGEEKLCGGQVLFERHLAAGSDPKGFGVTWELNEDFVCGFERVTVGALAELLFSARAQSRDTGVIRTKETCSESSSRDDGEGNEQSSKRIGSRMRWSGVHLRDSQRVPGELLRRAEMARMAFCHMNDRSEWDAVNGCFFSGRPANGECEGLWIIGRERPG